MAGRSDGEAETTIIGQLKASNTILSISCVEYSKRGLCNKERTPPVWTL
jgi:hypothetical protein